MKKFFFVFICFAPLLVFSQNFTKGTVSIHNNYGIDIYDTEYAYHVKIGSLDTTLISKDKAGNKNFTLGADYCVINKLAIGFKMKFNNYFTSEDSVTKSKPTAKSQDYVLFANYHLVDKRVFDLSAGIGIGGSHLFYNDGIKTSSSNGTIVRGNGPFIQYGLSPQFLIKQRVGLGISFYGAFVNYSKMTTSNDDVNKYVVSKWKGSGYGLSFNLNVLLNKN